MVDFPFSIFDYQIGIEKRWGWSWGKTPPHTHSQSSGTHSRANMKIGHNGAPSEGTCKKICKVCKVCKVIFHAEFGLDMVDSWASLPSSIRGCSWTPPLNIPEHPAPQGSDAPSALGRGCEPLRSPGNCHLRDPTDIHGSCDPVSHRTEDST